MIKAKQLIDLDIKCERCGNKMYPVLFEEKEFKKGVFTGKKRTAVSHLECRICGKKEVVDDSFDGDWHY